MVKKATIYAKTAFEKDEIHEKWARLWISDLPVGLNNHPNVVAIQHLNNNAVQVKTNDFPNFETELLKHGITINHIERLTLEEVMEFLIEEGQR